MSKRGLDKPSKVQISALQALYSLWQSHSLEEVADPRAARLAWASDSIGRAVSSFKELTSDEARRLIDVLKTSMGQKLTRQPRPWRKIRAGDRAHEAGTAGRKGQKSGVIQLVSPDDLARIDEALERLGWTAERFQSWLQSSFSPIRSGEKAIRTVADANKVWWALKAIMVRNGKWDPERTKHPVRGAQQTSEAKAGNGTDARSI